MKAFYGSRISENMTKTPEGFLICFNVPIARTGWYEYLAQEIGVEGSGIVKVYRSPEEVFSKKAIASFEGKIVTDNHPPELLTPETAGFYTKGAMQNVRRSIAETDLLLADLIIYNQRLIDEIEKEGKREVSCGYEYNLLSNGDGTYSQTNIVGNHVAVVESGRAGDRVAIMDSKLTEMEGEKKRMNKVKIPKKQRGPITNLFAAMGVKHFAADAEPQELAEALDALAEERETENLEGEEVKATPKAEDAEPNEFQQLAAKVDKLTEIVTQLVESDKKVHEEIKPEDAIDEFISELSKNENSTGDEEESVTVPVEEMDEDIPEGVVVDPEDRPENPIQGADSIATIRALKAMKPVIAAIKDPTERKKACDSLLAEFKKAKKSTSRDNAYQKILNAQRINSRSKAQKAEDSKEKTYANIEDNYKKMNSHAKKEMK